MGTEVWFRNPHDYIRELVEAGESKVTWDRGLLVKRKIDPVKHAELYFDIGVEYRVLCVGSQGTAEYRRGDTLEKPSAVYPTWEYGEDSTLLEEMLEYPIGEDEDSLNDQTVRGDERPVRGQEHRVIVTNTPHATSGPGRSFLRYLKTLQEDYPKSIIHVHGLYGWKTAFGMGFGAADIAPRDAASKGRIHLPTGKIVKHEQITSSPQWATMLGFKPTDLAVPRNRCMYNIKSAVWAGDKYEKLYKFRASGSSGDYESSDKDHVPVTTNSHRSDNRKKVQEGDKLLCNTCSLQNSCKYFREGAVCTVPGAEPVRLAKMFSTRNADDIIDGLSLLMSAGSNRLEKGIHNESIDGELSPEVTRMMGQLFDQGTKLAKLIEPARFANGTKVQVNVGQNGTATVAAVSERDLVKNIIQQFVNNGIPRDKITTEMIQGVLESSASKANTQKAIQGQATVVSEDR